MTYDHVFLAAQVSLSAKFLLFFIPKKQIKSLNLRYDFKSFMCSFVAKQKRIVKNSIQIK